MHPELHEASAEAELPDIITAREADVVQMLKADVVQALKVEAVQAPGEISGFSYEFTDDAFSCPLMQTCSILFTLVQDNYSAEIMYG